MSDSQPLVIFDAGGVLVRICRTWEEGARRAGIEAPPDVMADAARARRRELSLLYQAGRLPEDEYFARMAEAVGGEASAGGSAGACTPDIIERVHDAWLVEEYPGVRALVHDLRAAGLPTALLSNTNARHWAVMAEAEGPFAAVGTLDRWFLSHELGACKPEEAIYAAVEEAVAADVGAAPDRIIFFDDLEENVAAARARGWRAVQVDHTGDTAAQMRRALGDLGVL